MRRRAPHGCGAGVHFRSWSPHHPIIPVVVTPPDALFVAPFRGAVEPLVHAPESVQSTGIGRIGMIDDVVLVNESAETGPLAHIGGWLGGGPRRVFGHGAREGRF